MKSIIIILTLVFISCNESHNHITNKINQVQLTKEIDPDIVIINIEEGDRTFIGHLITKVDSCNPKIIGINVTFEYAKDKFQDSILEHSLLSTDKDIISCYYDTTVICPIERFDKVADKGINHGIEENGIITKFVPITIFEGKTYEHFTLKIAKKWIPTFEPKYIANEEIEILYKRKMEQYITIKGSELNYEKHARLLNNKIVLLGYLGPTNENKLYTLLRFVENYPKNEPDTYGTILVANEIRTILDQIGR